VRRVYAYVAYRLGDGPDAEDVTSDVFERALRYRESYDSRKSEPIAWLIGIARRCIVDAAATRAEPVADPPAEAAPGDLEDEAVRRLTLRNAVVGLDARDQELISPRGRSPSSWACGRTPWRSRSTVRSSGFAPPSNTPSQRPYRSASSAL
jgi:RNA polymerase sigma factor (sigma-70 family)